MRFLPTSPLWMEVLLWLLLAAAGFYLGAVAFPDFVEWVAPE